MFAVAKNGQRRKLWSKQTFLFKSDPLLISEFKNVGCCLKLGLLPMLIGALSGVTGGVNSDNNFAFALMLPVMVSLWIVPSVMCKSGTLSKTL